MSFIVLANFKSHKSASEINPYLETISTVVNETKGMVTTLIAPSTIHLPQASSFIQKNNLDIKLTAQDVSPFPPGSYTGAVNAHQLKDYQVSYCLIGHSERRRYFHETYVEVANKAIELLSLEITPAICLAREDINPQFAVLEDVIQNQCLYCFEPPVDIGGTVTAPLDLITDTISMIKRYTNSPVLYGGSVTADNIDSLLDIQLDGVLVATASLDPNNLKKIITKASHAR
ncbi:MAG: triose-phosphate isomerase [Candidatus Microgenomates bacterium]